MDQLIESPVSRTPSVCVSPTTAKEKDWAMAQEQGQATVQAHFLLLHRRCRQEVS